MGLRDTFSFNADKYTCRMQGITSNELLIKYSCHNVALSAKAVCFGAGMVHVIATAGATLPVLLYTVRQIFVLIDQQEVIELVLRKRGITAPDITKEETAAGRRAGLIGVLLTLGISNFSDLMTPGISIGQGAMEAVQGVHDYGVDAVAISAVHGAEGYFSTVRDAVPGWTPEHQLPCMHTPGGELSAAAANVASVSAAENVLQYAVPNSVPTKKGKRALK